MNLCLWTAQLELAGFTIPVANYRQLQFYLLAAATDSAIQSSALNLRNLPNSPPSDGKKLAPANSEAALQLLIDYTEYVDAFLKAVTDIDTQIRKNSESIVANSIDIAQSRQKASSTRVASPNSVIGQGIDSSAGAGSSLLPSSGPDVHLQALRAYEPRHLSKMVSLKHKIRQQNKVNLDAHQFQALLQTLGSNSAAQFHGHLFQFLLQTCARATGFYNTGIDLILAHWSGNKCLITAKLCLENIDLLNSGSQLIVQGFCQLIAMYVEIKHCFEDYQRSQIEKHCAIEYIDSLLQPSIKALTCPKINTYLCKMCWQDNKFVQFENLEKLNKHRTIIHCRQVVKAASATPATMPTTPTKKRKVISPDFGQPNYKAPQNRQSSRVVVVANKKLKSLAK